MLSDGQDLPNDSLQVVFTLEKLSKQWVKTRNSVSAALAILKNEHRSVPPVSKGPVSVMKRLMNRLGRKSPLAPLTLQAL
jgi:hypothetical protein